jgi:hypothetical protein
MMMIEWWPGLLHWFMPGQQGLYRLEMQQKPGRPSIYISYTYRLILEPSRYLSGSVITM